MLRSTETPPLSMQNPDLLLQTWLDPLRCYPYLFRGLTSQKFRKAEFKKAKIIVFVQIPVGGVVYHEGFDLVVYRHLILFNFGLCKIILQLGRNSTFF